MIEIQERDFRSSHEEKEGFVNAYLEIFNAPENLKYLSFTGIPFRQDIVHSWVHGLDEHADIRYRIAVIAENIVGISVLKHNPLQGFELLGLAVHPEFKRKGVGTALLADCIRCSDAYRAIDALVFADNAPMLILLLKHGFIPVKMINELRYDGVDTILLKHYKNSVT